MNAQDDHLADSVPGVNPGYGLLLAFVADRDEPCPVCSYSLRGLTEPVCPECGAALRLQVGSPQLRIGAWALAMVSFALGLGFDGVVTIFFTIGLIMDPTVKWQPFGLVTGFVLMSASMLGCLIWMARTRHKWHRLPTRSQWRWAAAIFVGVGLLHVFYGFVCVLITRSM